jgi:glycosyltransferase involved in cell wall biosynthesis
MNNNLLVTIGVPVYNEQKNIYKCLKNILSQSYKNIEVIVSDNNSTDKTLSICKKLKKKDKRIKIFENKINLGQGFNFYNVLKKAKGKYFMYQAADDLRSSNFIRENLNFLLKNKEYAVSTGVPILDKKKMLSNYLFQLKKCQYQNIKNFFKIKWHSHSIIYGLYKKKKIIEFLNFFKSDNYLSKDWLFNLLILSSEKLNVQRKTNIKFGNGLSKKKDAIQLQKSKNKLIYLLESLFPILQLFLDFIKYRKKFTTQSQLFIIKELLKLHFIISFINIKKLLSNN